MRRLVYAPKVWIFIRSSNLDGRIYDVTSDIVRGSVTQNLGDISTCEFELRNRFYKYLRARNWDNRLIFRPMDLVTIWMQRISGFPIQVFTGYLDEVPYYQAYPGNAVFSASCTMKKLAYNWFDPGLPVFHNWVRAQPGWEIDPATGEAVNWENLSISEDITDETFRNPEDVSPVTDGGFGDLLGRFMVDIAGWDPDDVLIASLPEDIPQKAAELYNDLEGQTQTNLDALTKFMAQILGADGWTGIPTLADAHDRDVTLSPTSFPALAKIRQVSAQNNIDPAIMLLAALALTGVNPSFNQDEDGTDAWGYGLYGMRPNSSDIARRGGGDDDGNVAQVDGVSLNRIIGDEFVATDVFAKRMNSASAQGEWVERAKAGDVDAMFEWIGKALGRTFTPRGEPNDLYERASKAMATGPIPKPDQVPKPKIDPKNVSVFDPQIIKILSAEEKKIVNKYYKNSEPEIGKLILEAKNFDLSLTVGFHPSMSANELFIEGKTVLLERFFNHLKKNDTLSAVALYTGSDKKFLRDGEESQLEERIDKTGIKLSANLAKMRENPDQATGGDDDSEALGEGSITFSQLAAFSSNAAFASKFAFPSNIIQSLYLTGEKALMNDISCLEAVKQFCQASLRTFRSLPDGRFLAFYPDYFGASRPPYWAIHNIEIIDFGIQLNDESLATHVYVVGDMGAARLSSGLPEWFGQVASRGVATLTQAFILNSFIEPFEEIDNPKQGGSRGILEDPFEFIQHYGMRPHKEEQALITNPFYEFMMAWQKFMWLWAQQFSTMVEFTFQPEVMAGGLIEFPDHDVQMFCESVTHNFDYGGGFTTTANLSAPSIPVGKRNSKINKPGFALGGQANTVGVSR